MRRKVPRKQVRGAHRTIGDGYAAIGNHHLVGSIFIPDFDLEQNRVFGFEFPAQRLKIRAVIPAITHQHPDDILACL